MMISSKDSLPKRRLPRLTLYGSSDTTAIAVQRYEDIVATISETLNKEDQLVIQEHRTWQGLVSEIRGKLMDPDSSASLRRSMSSIQPLPRSIGTLNDSFISAVSPQNIQFDFLWGMFYLNLKVAYMSKEQD